MTTARLPFLRRDRDQERSETMPTRAQIIEAVLSTAAREVGQRETSANWSQRIGEYLRRAGITVPAPWCAAFSYWATDLALEALDLRNPVVRTGYCPLVHTWAREHGALHDAPQRGDYFLYVNGGRARHIGFVTETHGARFGTVEGNTNLGGSPEGIGVFERTRPVSHQYRFVRWADVVAVPEQARTVPLLVSGERWADLPLLEGRALAPVRWWGEKMGFTVGWDADRQSVLYNGQEVPTEVTLLEGTGYAPIRDLARFSGLLTAFTSGQVLVTRG